ncbi:CAAX prenyl protease-related protein [Pseudoduganella violacea]|uniref:CAAX prenyl protease 2/Lysostaphin resistance protein A-like domain-containing protein n=1 Tax=Pseudoduganella violacea TaxID=1715466 RepID=A0A7W5BAI6_9BURK|nr:CAAX prenyl protease-related protein [Pseudoduganella violacea]MBB3119597.1 hypothetical protein [Pseudoduganella violacea]
MKTQQSDPTRPAAAQPAGPDSAPARQPALVRILPFAAYMACIAIADLLDRFGLAAAELRWLYAVKIGVVLALLFACRRHYRELAWQPLGARGWLAAVASGLLVLLLWVHLDAAWMQIGTPAGFDPRGAGGQIDWPLALVRIAGAALVVPLMEELFWRSFLLRWLERADFLKVNPAHVKFKAFIVTVILFGLEHHLWFAGMVAGAAYGLVYMRSQNLWSPIIAHAVTNGGLGVWVLMTGNWSFW